MNIAVITTLKYCYKKALNKKLKLMGGAIKYLMKKLLGYKILWSVVSWATKCFWKIYKILCLPPRSPYVLNVRSRMHKLWLWVLFFLLSYEQFSIYFFPPFRFLLFLFFNRLFDFLLSTKTSYKKTNYLIKLISLN